MAYIVGVLALQGDFSKHLEMLQALKVEAIEVRTPKDLDRCSGLIIPGGESTVMLKRLDFINMKERVIEFGKTKPIFGTCAGLILMSNLVVGSSMNPLGLLDISVERNAFGRQIESFEAEVELDLPDQPIHTMTAFFIRAPQIRSTSADVKTLASYKGEPVLVQQGHHLGASFHPELTGDPSVHRYFLTLIESINSR